MTDSLMMAAIESFSQTVNSHAAEAAGRPLPRVRWMWDCCAHFTDTDPEFCGTIDPDIPAIEASAQLQQWAIALNMVESTTDREAAEGRRSFSGHLANVRLRLTAAVESLTPTTETQPLLIMS
ncbi:hypothetical protein AB0L82_14565 [Nocardia sp. NPDC052001]|uniref:hypothetical protein n=1 Tax=unclassified Nocardia TaxID=2637762 RepID=UPI00343974F0